MENEPMTLVRLPSELLLHISSFVYLPDLLDFSLVCKGFYGLLLGRLREEWRLQQQFTKVTYKSYDSAYSLRERGLFAYLALFLENSGAAHYVKRLEIEDIESEAKALALTDKEERDVMRALSSSKWLPRPSDEMLEKIRLGDDDYVLALMLDLLPSIVEIVLPAHCWGGVNLDPTIDAVAAIARNPQQPSPSLPLHNLRHIEGTVFNGFYGIGFKGLAPFLALPNVRTVNAACVAEDEFEWPESLPRSRVEKIYLEKSTVTLSAIKGLAKGIIGPCHVHHEWGWRRHDTMPVHHNDWTELRIPFENAPEETWMVENIVEFNDEDVSYYWRWR